MPLTLVTGLPGAAKTLYTIARWMPLAAKENRPVFYAGIKGCRVPGWQEWEVEKWQDLPPTSIFIIDEAQFKFPPTGKGATPEWVKQLSVHRHSGVDLVLITQHPMLLDSFPRRLVQQHFHLVRKFGWPRSAVYEFATGVREDVDKRRADGIRSEFKYPKEIYALYDSAEAHTFKRQVPFRVALLFSLPVFLGLLIWYGYNRAHQLQTPPPAPAVVESPRLGGSEAQAPSMAVTPMTPAQYVAAYTPRLVGLPHTAPVYDAVTQPQQAPYPAACLASTKRCQCYSQQGTRLDMADQLCRQIADGGFFVAWAPSGERVQQVPRDEQERPGRDRLQLAQAAPPTAAAAPQFAPADLDPNRGELPRRVRRAIQ